MRTLYSRTDPIGFGKYAMHSPANIAKNFPAYFAWLSRAGVIQFLDPADQKWYENKARKTQYCRSACQQSRSTYRRTGEMDDLDMASDMHDANEGSRYWGND